MSVKTKQPIQQAVKDLRLAIGMTQEQFARYFGVSLRSVLNYELTKPPRGMRLLVKFAKLADQHNQLELREAFLEAVKKRIKIDFPEGVQVHVVLAPGVEVTESKGGSVDGETL